MFAIRNAARLAPRGARLASTKPAPKSTWQTWFEPAAVPIYVVVGGACAGAAWYLTHLARHPDVIWDRHNNPEPWNNVEQGTNTKLHSINKEFFTKEYSRGKL
ncbi:hypothetical protein JCM5296_006306 [Sporobolomyces johnsonii]